jgi:protein TonB
VTRPSHLVLALLLSLVVNGIGVVLLVRFGVTRVDLPPPVEPRTLGVTQLTVSMPEPEPRPPTPQRPSPRATTAAPRPSLAPPSLPSRIKAETTAEVTADAASFLDAILAQEVGEVAGLSSLIFAEESVDVPPRLIRRVEPEYPRQPYRLGIEGEGMIRLLINRTGRVERAIVVEFEPPDVFDETVLRAVRRWEFEPAIYRGEPVAVWVGQAFRFHLED